MTLTPRPMNWPAVPVKMRLRLKGTLVRPTCLGGGGGLLPQ